MRRRRFTAFVEALVEGRRPESFQPDPDDVAAMRAAIELRAARGDTSAPSAQFVSDLQDRLRQDGQEQQGEQQPESRRRVPRRWVLEGAGVAAAAGVAVALDRTVFSPGGSQTAQPQLTPDSGAWQPVGSSAALTRGAVIRFDTAGVAGFVSQDNGGPVAVTGACTHQGCLLELDAPAGRLNCPCHRTAFALSGHLLVSQLPTPPRPLPRLQVRDRDGQVEVFLPRPV